MPPLRGECRWLLDRRRNPFFAYGDVELFTVRRGGRVAGRIAAVHNPATTPSTPRATGSSASSPAPTTPRSRASW
ncbi:hypothetical protein ACFQYP_22805 [Nonomuraea antimicrobica]